MAHQATFITKRLNLCIMAGLIIVLPFATGDNLMFPTQSAKFFLFSLAMIVIFSLFLLQFIFQKDNKSFHSPSPQSHSQIPPQSHLKRTLRITTLDILLAAFILYAGVNVLFNIDRYGISHRFIELLGLSALYLVFRRLSSRAMKVLLIALLVSGAAQAIYGNLQLYGVFPSNHNMFSITGGFFNPGPYAGYLAVIFPMALVMYFASSGNEKKAGAGWKVKIFKSVEITETLIFRYVSLAAIIAIVLVLPATRSRAAWIAVAVASAFIFPGRPHIGKVLKKHVNSMTGKVALAAFAIVLTGLAITGLYIMKKGSADGRLLIWKVTANMISEKPLFGFGYDRFKANYMNFQAEYFSSESSASDSEGGNAQTESFVAGNSTRAFNEYLQMTTEGGLAGVLMVLAVGWSFSFCVPTHKGRQPIHVAAKMGVLAFGTFALFSYPTEILPIKLCATFCLASVASNQKHLLVMPACRTGRDFKNLFPAKASRGLWATTSLAGLVGVALLTVPLSEGYKSYKNWKQAYLTYQMGAYEVSVKEYQEIYVQLKNNGEYLVNYGKACSMAGHHGQAIEVLTRAEQFLPNTIVYTTMGDSYRASGKNRLAEQAYIKAANMLPDRFYPKFLLAKLYDETNQKEKAHSVAKDILALEAKVMSAAVKEIRQEMKDMLYKSIEEPWNKEPEAEPQNSHAPDSGLPSLTRKEVKMQR